MSKMKDIYNSVKSILLSAPPSGMNAFGNMVQEAAEEDFNARVTKDAMLMNSYVNIAVSKIASNASRSRVEIKQGDDKIETGPIVDLFDWVNPILSESQLIQASASWWFSRGEFFWILLSELPGKVPSEIFIPNPNQMKHFVDSEGKTITAWEYKPLGEEGLFLLPHEVLHFKDWNPFTPFRGVNPLYALADELDSDFYANILNNSLLKNRATPDGILTSDQPLSSDQAKDIKERWDKAHSITSAHSIAVLGQGTSYSPVTLSLADMEFYTMKKWNRTTVAGKYGVPPVAMGYKDDNSPLSGSDTKEQMVFFWTQTIIPFLKVVADKVNSNFMSIYAPQQTFRFGLEDIQELAEDTEKIRERARADIASGLLLINEAREEIGRDPVSWGDTWYKPINIVPLQENEPLSPTAQESINTTDITTLFDKPTDIQTLFTVREDEIYPDDYKNVHWNMLHDALGIVVKNSRKDFSDWLYFMRSQDLEYEALDEFNKLLEDRNVFFGENKQRLVGCAQRLVLGVGEITSKQLNEFYNEIQMKDTQGFEMGSELTEMYFGHFGYFFDQLKEELLRVSDKKLLYNQMKSALNAVVVRESMTLFNEIRATSFKENGFTGHVWISPQDGTDVDKDGNGQV